LGAWLVNTGWTGGPFGKGRRISLAYTRALIDAVLSGSLQDVPFVTDPVFGLEYPESCPGVPAHLLNPRASWPDSAAYDDQAAALARKFHENFACFEGVDPAIRAAGPRLGRV